MTAPRPSAPLPTGAAHIRALTDALARTGPALAATTTRWGRHLADRMPPAGGGHRLLTVGNGGSAAQAQHLTAELVGRFRDDRPPLSAIALHAETSSLTAIGNDFGADEVFARQVVAHGRPGDVLLALSTSGRSSNVVRAARAGRRAGLTVWAMTGPVPNPLADLCHDALTVDAATPTVQEVHLVALHLVCAALDVALGVSQEAADADEVPAWGREMPA